MHVHLVERDSERWEVLHSNCVFDEILYKPLPAPRVLITKYLQALRRLDR